MVTAWLQGLFRGPTARLRVSLMPAVRMVRGRAGLQASMSTEFRRTPSTRAGAARARVCVCVCVWWWCRVVGPSLCRAAGHTWPPNMGEIVVPTRTCPSQPMKHLCLRCFQSDPGHCCRHAVGVTVSQRTSTVVTPAFRMHLCCKARGRRLQLLQTLNVAFDGVRDTACTSTVSYL